ncbi:MAG: hypothetical protein ACI8P3_001794 [Saprospiraceae bacterium]|jgi:hypothetical protein
MFNIKNIITFFLVLTFSSTVFAGGGWPQPKGHGYFKLFQWWVVADQHFTNTGGIDPNVTNGIFNTGAYGEYGFTDRITGIAYVPFFSRAYFNNTVSGTTGEIIDPGESINSFGDTNLGIKYSLIVNKPIAVSATLTFGLPLGNNSGGKTGRLQTGDGEFNQLLQLDAGVGFKVGKLNTYANIYAGVNNRSNGFSDEFHYGIETGTSLFKEKLSVTVRLFGIKSFKNGDLNDQINSTSIFANNSEHLSFSPEFAYNINKRWGVSATLGTALYGRIIFANPSYSFGVFFKL